MCDFGLAKNKDELSIGTGQYSGTPAYMAPELFNKRPYTEKVDIYAFGVVIWETILGKIPFEGLEVLDIRNCVVEGKGLPTPENKFSKPISELINLCQNSEPEKRPDFTLITEKLIKYRKTIS